VSNNIEHKDLFRGLGNIKRPEQWRKAGEKLGFRLCGGKGSHLYNFRDPSNPIDNSTASLITTIPTGLHKKMNEIIFKEILNNNLKKVSEDEIWKALEMLA
jgi:predicted RNA binding protein YcfA (HicA-like mRNA interferase family)